MLHDLFMWVMTQLACTVLIVRYSYVWHDSFMGVPWHTHEWCISWSMKLYSVDTQTILAVWRCHLDVTYDTTCLSRCWLNTSTFIPNVCKVLTESCPSRVDATHVNVWHDSFICVPRLIHMCAMTHSYLWHDSFIFTWVAYPWSTATRVYASIRGPQHDSFTCVPYAHVVCVCVCVCVCACVRVRVI